MADQVQLAKPSSEDIILWPDSTWCYREELHRMSHMSDDYEVLWVGTARHEEFHLTLSMRSKPTPAAGLDLDSDAPLEGGICDMSAGCEACQ